MAVDPLRRQRSQSDYLGFDYGDKKIGIAVGNRETGLAAPLETVAAVKFKTNWARITVLIEQWQPEGLVVGISRQHNGRDNPVTPKIERFSRQLEGRYQLPVHLIDETLTTYESKQLLFDELNLSASKLWAVQDQLAAQLILQTFLNHSKREQITQ